jgi:valyl-tRNA synthetase
MEKNYQFKEIEPKIYSLWENSDCFKADAESSKPSFSIVLPPPNANAAIHIGHSLYSIEDALIRYKKMKGFETLWLPGADHAGFETQVVYEKQLEKEGKSRFDFSREDLYKNIYDFVVKNKSTVQDQLRRHGFSLDWTRYTFTLDDKVISTVYGTFEKLFNEGLVYRGERLVNYCTVHETGFSDLEISYSEKTDFLYYVKYKIVNSSDSLLVATARPETIFVDVALCVNPNDERYQPLIGKKVINPLNNEIIPIISDEDVEIGFGTGVLKITPLHDFKDFEIAKRHNLTGKSVINKKGRLNELAGKFEGLKVKIAREQVVEYLNEIGVLVDKIELVHSVPCCYKCNTVIEPILLPQWFVKTKPLAEKALQSFKNGETKIHPERFSKVYTDWLENIIDWNISRQIVWGIRIPAYECNICSKWVVSTKGTPEKCDCGSTGFTQDTDTFDTWFSSGQWPFATLGLGSKEFQKFYPTSVIETGYDILFFWVARMVMLGIYRTGKAPFKDIVLHGIVRDSKGQKMSKSKGNVVNPLEIIDKYGADVLRMSLIMSVPFGNDQNYSEPKFVGSRNFANKVWNMARFIKIMSENASYDLKIDENSYDIEKLDSEIFKNHQEFIKKINVKLDKISLSEVAEEIHSYMWHQVADIYIEKCKENKELLPLINTIFKDCLKVLHLFMPFITEEIWQNNYSNETNPILMNTRFPEY